jgi:NAD(P)-dependent dehydrogenase (short-subunit alcohol dehydrogenase family)
MPVQEFEGRVAIVTGGGNGMGERVVHTLAAAGARVVIADKDPQNGARVAAEAGASAATVSAGGSVEFIEVDVSVDDAVRGLVADVLARHGRIDAIDNNAAALELTAEDGAVADLDPQLFLDSLRGDLYAPFLCCKHVIPAMLRGGGGSILNMASVSGFGGELTLTAYGVAKAGVMQLTRAVATQYGRAGIRCNAIAPSYVTTPNNALYAPKALEEIYARATPGQGVPSPQEIAEAVVFLLSDRARLISGQVLAVDGGLRAAAPIVPDYRDWQAAQR